MESVEVEAKSKVVRVDEEAATIKATEAQALKDECESELAEAIPALEAALSALNTLKVKQMSANRSASMGQDLLIRPNQIKLGFLFLFHISPLMSRL